MGASGWAYKVRYRADVAAALQALRQDVFARREYYPASINPSYAAAMGIEPMTQQPESIEDLLDMQEEEGTHSILDISVGVSDEPGFGRVSPLSQDELAEVFGSATPSTAQVDDWMNAGGYSDYCDRWAGVYVIGYEDAAPVTLHFGGFSGD